MHGKMDNDSLAGTYFFFWLFFSFAPVHHQPDCPIIVLSAGAIVPRYSYRLLMLQRLLPVS